ncbi:MAG: NADH-quinone oxidoreductase subunit L [Actinobacteria bacterium]|uniref:Unannotated protein n=1 Tax=freshwater metagenome TaxID=449393 RepID=A0A6J7EEI1_9ZZZZ|nr:NADH-quinone oxidoreductase subunit L [Actinomycetota bacterium]
MSLTTYSWLVLAFPLAGSIILGLGHKVLKGKTAGAIGTSAILLSFLSGLGALRSLQSRPEESRQVVSSLWTYAHTGGLDVQFSILVDPLSLLMVLVVAGVSTLIHLYSVAYMASDEGYVRFFAYLNFFVFSMLMLVLAGNLILLAVGWGLVGAASYLLISFWYRRNTATKAGIKAFVINVVGDVGIVLGAIVIIQGTGAVDLLTVFAKAPQVWHTNDPQIVVGCLLLMVGAFAKSAQVPFHTWLPDAMEGPTPVSALIHAATMVTAGVYLIARMHPIFQIATTASDVGAIGGAVTLLVAATIGLVVTDLKRVIAYSTMSQIGYMIMAVSAGVYGAGLFHLMTHAFFKALLFMAAGSVIGAMAGEQNLDRMGGFRKVMPITYGCFIVGGLALSGIPPFSGFFSKDDILLGLGAQGGWYWALYVAGYVGALMTAIYTFRMIFRAFHGEPCEEAKSLADGRLFHAAEHRNPGDGTLEDTGVGYPGAKHHIAERSPSMSISMGVLAILATIGGVIQLPKVTNTLDHFLDPTFSDSPKFGIGIDYNLMAIGMVIGAVFGLLGIYIAWVIWVKKPGTSARIQARFALPYKLFSNKWYFDEIIAFLIVRPFAAAGRFFQRTVERVVVDGAITAGPVSIARASSAAVRSWQSGMLRAYAAAVIVGAALVVLYLMLQA